MVPIIKRKEAAKSSAMLNRIFSDQLGDLQNALSRTGQRQALLTENLANANVPHYKRHDIDFHVALQSQMHFGNRSALPGTYSARYQLLLGIEIRDPRRQIGNLEELNHDH
jgi:flagellar basal-body rod protein FlgB